MPRITINYDKCKGCLLCISFCPKNLIVKSDKLNRQGLNYVEFSRQAFFRAAGIPRQGGGKENSGCLGCAMCAIICPDCCITVYK